MPATQQEPSEDQEYEDLLISVVTRIVTILSESDDAAPDPESKSG